MDIDREPPDLRTPESPSTAGGSESGTETGTTDGSLHPYGNDFYSQATLDPLLGHDQRRLTSTIPPRTNQYGPAQLYGVRGN
jgi:hypothetical protein